MSLQVLVVGAGPVGLTMAAELARFGVPVRIVEKAAARTDKSKALAIWPRTLELIDRMGCGQTFVDAGLKVVAANIIAGDKPIARIPLDQVKTPHPYALMLPQSETERLMEHHLNTCGVQVERQVELSKFVPGASSVIATLHHADGRDETIDVPWLIGCDGAHSTVRHGLGMQFEGDTQPSDWFLADLHLSGQSSWKQNELYLFWHPAGVLVIIPIMPGRFRVIADAGEATSAALRADPTLQEVQKVLDQRGPGSITASNPNWLASFRINERKVADYRAGQVFLAGDAAHIHSPAGGQGMNTGMQDACNLAWKLALVHHGVAAPEPLLDSYSTERSAVGRQVLKDAGRLTTLAILKGDIPQAIRNHVAALLLGLHPARELMADKLTELSIGYPKSPLTVPNRHIHHGPHPGERMPVSPTGEPIGAGDTPKFALFAPVGTDAATFITRYASILEPTPRPPIDPNTITLVRPDGYVATTATTGQWSEIDSYFRHIGISPQP